MSELERIGIAGPNYLKETLTNCSDPLKAIEEFQEQNNVLLPSLRPALHFLDLHSISRIDFHSSVVDVLREALIKQITEIQEKEPEKERLSKLNELLDKSFPVITKPTLQSVPMHIMKHLPKIKDDYLRAIEADPALYKIAPTEVRRQIWQKNQALFGDEVSPILNSYIRQKQLLLFEYRSRKNFFSVSPKARRQEELLRKLVDMIGRSVELYDMVLQFLRTLFLRTRNMHYCTLRSDILMALHENDVSDIFSLDPSHKFAWCLDACIREHFVDSKRAKELLGFLDSIKKGQEEVLGDLAMILADPYALHTCCITLLKMLHTSASSEQLPRDNNDYVLLLRMIQLALSAWTMMDTATFKEAKIDVSLITQFLPELEALMVDELTRSSASKIPNAIIDIAGDIPQSLHKIVVENEVAAYVLAYFSTHVLNSREAMQFSSVLSALRDEGDVAYSDVLLHMIINEMVSHADVLVAANSLVFIVDTFFMPKIAREGLVSHLLRLLWNIQKKAPQTTMLELLSRISVDEQDESQSSLFKALQEAVEHMEPQAPAIDHTDSPLSGVPIPD